jgi:cytochrome c556
MERQEFMMRKLCTLLALCGGLFAALPIRADDQDVIDYRTHIMKTMDEQLGAIGMILENKAPPDNFAAHLKILAITASQAKKAFEPKVPGGNAKPEIWANWPDFSKRLDELAAGTSDLATAAQHESVAAVGGKLRSVIKCKSCHETYRLPLK